MKLLIDKNVIIDSLKHREPFSQKATLILVAGKVGEFELWMSSTQIPDLISSLNSGRNESIRSQVSKSVEGLLNFINVYTPGKSEIRTTLQTDNENFEDALLSTIAQKLQVDAFISSDYEEFFSELAAKGITYDLVDLEHAKGTGYLA